MDEAKCIKKIINKAIEKSGTVKNLAEILGINRSSVSRWIHGVHIPSANYIIKMQDLIKKDEKKNEHEVPTKRKKKQ